MPPAGAREYARGPHQGWLEDSWGSRRCRAAGPQTHHPHLPHEDDGAETTGITGKASLNLCVAASRQSAAIIRAEIQRRSAETPLPSFAISLPEFAPDDIASPV